MSSAFLLTGSNMGNRMDLLAQAREFIEKECGQIKNLSSIYETAAWGKEDQAPFLNQVIEISTDLTAAALLKQVLSIEKKMGRLRKEKYGPRVIDIDILLFANKIYKTSRLSIPHPELQNRRFALTPLAEIAGNYVHPVLHQSINNLLLSCSDMLPVEKVVSRW